MEVLVAHKMFSLSSSKQKGRFLASLRGTPPGQPPKELAPTKLNTLDINKPLPRIPVDDSVQDTPALVDNCIMLNGNKSSGPRKEKIRSLRRLAIMTTIQEISIDSPTIPNHRPAQGCPCSAHNESGRLRQCIIEAHAKPPDLNVATAITGKTSDTSIIESSLIKLAPIPQLFPVAPILKLELRYESSQCRSERKPPVPQRSRRLQVEISNPGRFATHPATALSKPRSTATTDTLSARYRRGLVTKCNESLQTDNSLSCRGEISGLSSIGTGKKSPELQKKSYEATNINGHQSGTSKRLSFQKLPIGMKLSEAMGTFDTLDVRTLHKQALQQAERFEVLNVMDADALSKELCYLDSRIEYIRRLCRSFRERRCHLRTNIRQCLGSPRGARFCDKTMLKQGETLAKLDFFLDDLETRLEFADNRRIRVFQKLQEHIAAAAILRVPDITASEYEARHIISPHISEVSPTF